MREFTRMALRLLMVIFLVAGCVENVYYLGELTKNSNYNSYHSYSNRYNNNTYQDAEEIEEIEEVQGDPIENEQQYYDRSTSVY